MKARYHQSNSHFLTPNPSRGFSRVMLPLLLALIVFFLLPGLLAAQQAGEAPGPVGNFDDITSPQLDSQVAGGSAPAAGAGLNEQAVAAAVAAAQPPMAEGTPAPPVLSRELRSDRLWLLPRHAEFTDMLNRAGRQALQHPDCNEVLYGSLNEFKTERIGTSFTILCMKDARTTFNQVFFADDLMSEEELAAAEVPDASGELERLRQMMQPSAQPGEASPGEQAVPPFIPEDLPAPVVF